MTFHDREYATQVVEKLNKDEQEGWTYTVSYGIAPAKMAAIAVYDHENIFMGWL